MVLVVYTARPDPVPYITHRVPVKMYNCSGFKARELGKKKALIVYTRAFDFFVVNYERVLIKYSFHVLSSSDMPTNIS